MAQEEYIFPLTEPYLKLEPKYSDLQSKTTSNSKQQNINKIYLIFCKSCQKCMNNSTSIYYQYSDQSMETQNITKNNLNQNETFNSKNLSRYCVICFTRLLSQIQKNRSSLDQSFPQPYIIQSNLEYPIITGNWSAFHELLLLSFMQKNGFYWQKAEQFMKYYGANYRSQQLQLHYEVFYAGKEASDIILNKNLIKKRQKNPNFCYSSKMNPYGNSTYQSYSSDSSMENKNIQKYYQKLVSQHIIKTESEIERDIQLLQFNNMMPNNEFQRIEEQIKLKILMTYNNKKQLRKQKQQCVLKFKDVILQKQIITPKNKDQVQVIEFSVLKKDIKTIYEDLYPCQKPKLFPTLNNTLKFSQYFMRYLSKQQFHYLNQVLSICHKIQNISVKPNHQKKKNTNNKDHSQKNVKNVRQITDAAKIKKQPINFSKLGFKTKSEYQNFIKAINQKRESDYQIQNLTIKKLNTFI